MLGASEQAADAFRVSSGLAISQPPRFMANSQTLFTSNTIPFAHIFKYSIILLLFFDLMHIYLATPSVMLTQVDMCSGRSDDTHSTMIPHLFFHTGLFRRSAHRHLEQSMCSTFGIL